MGRGSQVDSEKSSAEVCWKHLSIALPAGTESHKVQGNMPTVGRDLWEAMESQFRSAFRDWVSCRLHVWMQTAGHSEDPRIQRLSELGKAATSSLEMAKVWSASLDASGSIAKAEFLTAVIRTREEPGTFLNRVIGLMRKEVASSSDVLDLTFRTARIRDWPLPSLQVFSLYERRLTRFGMPQNLDILTEAALYALYVAWSPTSKIALPDNRRELLSGNWEGFRICLRGHSGKA
jgi:hypothetical protein